MTVRRVRGDVSESHQEEVKKLEEQASVVRQTAKVPRDGVDNSGLASWGVEVNVCKGDHEEEIAKFDEDTIRKETVFRTGI